MNSKRSYLDTLNAGRQRRPHTTLEQLNRSLQTLEERIDRTREEVADPALAASRYASHASAPRQDEYAPAPRQAAYAPAPRQGDYASATPRDYASSAPRDPAPAPPRQSDYAAPRANLPFGPGSERQRAPEPRSAYDYQSIARDIERVRGQEDSVAAVGKIAGEIKGLREELRHQMTSGLKREFETLRRDIERAYATHAGQGGEALGQEFQRISGAIQSLAEKSDDKGVGLLRQELEQVRAALDMLAREESVQSVDRRWDAFDRRFNDFEDRVSEGVKASDPALGALADRLEQISNAVHNLPESLSLRSLEEKVRALAGAVEHFVGQQAAVRGGETFTQIEERLDEISRAIVASTVAAQSPHFDPEPFERIEARISALARQIEEVAAEDRPSGEVIERLNMLSQRVDEIATRSAMPEKSVERLAKQIAQIADRIDHAPVMPDADAIFSGIEHRFDVLSSLIERRQGDAFDQGNALFRELERRLDDVAARIEQGPARPDANAIFSGIEKRFDVLSGALERRQGEALDQSNLLFRELERRLDEVSDRIEQRQTDAALDGNAIMGAIDARFTALAQRLESGARNGTGDAAIRSLEARLEDISDRLDQSASRFAGIDAGLISNLEAQVAGLTAHLAKPSAPLPDFEDLGPRLDEIEKSIAGSRESILEAARHAAENAARSLAGSEVESAAVSGLAQDVKALETLTRRSDERNSKTFEAIHDTLLKIVDRLGTLEEESPAGLMFPPLAAPGTSRRMADAPSIDPDEMPDFDAMTGAKPAGAPAPKTLVERSPAQAAAAAAVAALDADVESPPETSGRVRSMFGGLFSGRKEKEEPALAGSMPAAEPVIVEAAPAVSLDQPLDPKIANKPLEPGSGAPDLNAIMRRVRDERGQPVKHGETDAAKSDFIAAARRAAQAAAAEAEVLKRKADVGRPVKALRLGDLLRSRRKPILMGAAAIMIALAGLQLGKAFMKDGKEVARLDTPPLDAGQQLDTASLGSTAVAEDEAPAMDDEIIAAAPPGTMPMTDEPYEEVIEPALPGSVEPASSSPAAEAEAEPPVAEPAPEPSAAAETPASAPAVEVASVSAPVPEEVLPVIEVPADAGPQPLREAANAGDAKALFEVGSRFAEGRGTKENMAEAAKWYEKSAELGFAPAQFRIGNFYEKGLGVKRDLDKSKTWYQLSAAQGNASAMHNLAVLFAMGADGAADNESAARWFLQAAELGVKDSQFNLGILTAKGVGMKQDLEESYKWFALVAKTGDKDAAGKRDEIANALRPEQLEKARAATELWKPKPLDPESNTVEIPDSWQESQDKTAGIDMKKAVKNIQLILNKNGYDAGSADGVMGGKTKTAIAAFQKDNGMPATGAVDEKLVQALLAKK